MALCSIGVSTAAKHRDDKGERKDSGREAIEKEESFFSPFLHPFWSVAKKVEVVPLCKAVRDFFPGQHLPSLFPEKRIGNLFRRPGKQRKLRDPFQYKHLSNFNESGILCIGTSHASLPFLQTHRPLPEGHTHERVRLRQLVILTQNLKFE